MIGVLRIIKGWPIQYLIIGGYIGVVIMTFFAPEIIGYRLRFRRCHHFHHYRTVGNGAGVGLASSIQGRNPLTDGFRFDCLCIAYADDLRHGLWNDSLMPYFSHFFGSLLSTLRDVLPIAIILFG